MAGAIVQVDLLQFNRWFFMKKIVCLFALCMPCFIFAGCPFCDPKVVEAQSIYENESLYVFVDYAPVVKGHLLITPKRHMMKAHEMTQEEWAALKDAVEKSVTVFQKAYGTDQYLILEKNGPLAGQTVPHVHFHLLPFENKKMSDDAKTALFAKIFNQLPKRLSKEEIQREVEQYRKYLE
jgi:histidine triad (HIT) family protein